MFRLEELQRQYLPDHLRLGVTLFPRIKRGKAFQRNGGTVVQFYFDGISSAAYRLGKDELLLCTWHDLAVLVC